jgi:hypothetical protein
MSIGGSSGSMWLSAHWAEPQTLTPMPLALSAGTSVRAKKGSRIASTNRPPSFDGNRPIVFSWVRPFLDAQQHAIQVA